MIRRLLPIAALLVAASPAAAAPATFEGTCDVTGYTTFDPPLTSQLTPTKYEFKSGEPASGVPDGTSCTGTLNGKAYDGPTTVHVTGEADLSCGNGSTSTPGKGTLKFPDGSTFKFGYTFTALATEVDYVVTSGDAEARGQGSFMPYMPPSAPFECGPGGAGVSGLGYEGQNEPLSKPVMGTRPATHAERRQACLRKAKTIKNKEKRARAQRRCRRRHPA